ncbi:MAG: hypothetical protein WEB87_07250, partial [Bacteriovoracaceae bacterium]
FTQREEGKPIFDLMESPISAKINGEQVDIALIQDPDKQTKYRLADKDLAPGEHTLEIEHEFSENIKFSGGGVASGFWMSDLSDRKYLEQYLPSNLEFDQFKMSLEVQIINASEEHEVFANGEIDFFGDNHFKVEFPSYFTTSSMFFHLTPRDRFTKKEFIFTSINGSKIPVMAYSKSSWSLVNIENKIIEILKELEEKLGAWGHPGLTVYIAGSGGMEHSGATITSLWALGHELTHSYFARGVMPIDGNSGWLDEAIASWRDDGYKASSKPFYNSAKMAGFSPYKRTTDRKAYRQGASFMAFLNHELKDRTAWKLFWPPCMRITCIKI